MKDRFVRVARALGGSSAIPALLGLALASPHLSRAASDSMACRLAMIQDDQARLQALEQILSSGSKLGASDALALDRLSAFDVNPRVHSTAAMGLPSATVTDFLSFTGYTERSYNWLDRLRSLERLELRANLSRYGAFLRYIAREDPHVGVRDAAKNYLTRVPKPVRPSRVSSPAHDEERADAHDEAPETGYFEELKRMGSAAVQMLPEIMNDPDEWVQYRGAFLHLVARGTVNIDPAWGEDLYVVRRIGPAALNHFAERFAEVFPGARIVVDPDLKHGRWPDAFDIRGNDLVIPVSLLRRPNEVPDTLLDWSQALLAQRALAPGELDPLDGTIVPLVRGEATVAETRQIPLASLRAGRFALRRAWEKLRTAVALGATDEEYRNLVLAARERLDNEALIIAKVFGVTQRFSAIISDGNINGPDDHAMSLLYTAARGAVRRSVIFVEADQIICQLPLARLRNDASPMQEMAATLKQFDAMQASLKRLRSQNSEMKKMLHAFEITRGTRARAQLLIRADFDEPAPEIKNLMSSENPK